MYVSALIASAKAVVSAPPQPQSPQPFFFGLRQHFHTFLLLPSNWISFGVVDFVCVSSLLRLRLFLSFFLLLLQLWLILKLAIKATRNASGNVVGRSSRGRCESSDSDSDAWLLSPAFKYTGTASSCALSLSLYLSHFLSLSLPLWYSALSFGLPAKSQCALVRAALCWDALPAAFFVRSLTCGAASNCVERVCFCWYCCRLAVSVCACVCVCVCKRVCMCVVIVRCLFCFVFLRSVAHSLTLSRSMLRESQSPRLTFYSTVKSALCSRIWIGNATIEI